MIKSKFVNEKDSIEAWECLRALCELDDELSVKESEFLESVCKWRGNFSVNQYLYVIDLYNRYCK